MTDTGIGIPPDKHAVIFEAFQQAEGTSRSTVAPALACPSAARSPACSAAKFGSRARRARQHVHALPAADFIRPPRAREEPGTSAPRPAARFRSGRARPGARRAGSLVKRASPTTDKLEPGDRVLLIVEDDPSFAHILLDLARTWDSRAGGAAGRPGAGAGARVPARAVTLDSGCPTRAGPSSTGSSRPGDAAHPGAHHLGR